MISSPVIYLLATGAVWFSGWLSRHYSLPISSGVLRAVGEATAAIERRHAHGVLAEIAAAAGAVAGTIPVPAPGK